MMTDNEIALWEKASAKGINHFVRGHAAFAALALGLLMQIPGPAALLHLYFGRPWQYLVGVVAAVVGAMIGALWSRRTYGTLEAKYKFTIAQRKKEAGEPPKFEKPPHRWSINPEIHRLIALLLFLPATLFATASIAGGGATATTLISAAVCLLALAKLCEGGCRIDLRKRAIVRTYGFVLPLRSIAISFDEIREIRSAQGKRQGDQNPLWMHVIVETARGETYLIRRSNDLPMIRWFAENLRNEVATQARGFEVISPERSLTIPS